MSSGDPSPPWISSKFPFTDDPAVVDSGDFGSFPDILQRQSGGLVHESSTNTTGTTTTSAAAAAAAASTATTTTSDNSTGLRSPLDPSESIIVSGPPSSKLSGVSKMLDDNRASNDFVHGFPGMTYGHGSRRDSSSTAPGFLGSTVSSPSIVDVASTSASPTITETKPFATSYDSRYSRPTSPRALGSFSEHQHHSHHPHVHHHPHPGLKTPYSDPLIPVPGSSSASTGGFMQHNSTTSHAGPSRQHSHSHLSHSQFNSPRSTAQSPADSFNGGNRIDLDDDSQEVEPEVLNLVNDNQEDSDDSDEDSDNELGDTKPFMRPFGSIDEGSMNSSLAYTSVSADTPTTGDPQDKTSSRAYNEAQRLINQATQNAGRTTHMPHTHQSVPTSGIVPGRMTFNHSNGTVGRSERIDRATHSATPSPLADESGRAGNSNFLVEMARMSTSMNGQVVSTDHSHDSDIGGDGGVLVQNLYLPASMAPPPQPTMNQQAQQQSQQSSHQHHHTHPSETQEDELGADDEQDEEPLYVNAKQYHRILKRRAARARLEEMNRVVKERKVS